MTVEASQVSIGGLLISFSNYANLQVGNPQIMKVSCYFETLFKSTHCCFLKPLSLYNKE